MVTSINGLENVTLLLLGIVSADGKKDDQRKFVARHVESASFCFASDVRLYAWPTVSA